MAITITEKAAEKVKSVLQEKGKPDAALRLYIQGGGCAGFQYGMSIDDAPNGSDKVFEEHGVKVVVDMKSYLYLNGAQIDWTDSLLGGGFKIENPNAISTCGCGHSFNAAGAPEGKPCH